MRISAPWIGLPLESFTKPLSPADPCALTFSIRQNETNPIATTRMSIFMLQEYDFGRVCKTRPDTGNLPAEGLEPTRSCDHWILSRSVTREDRVWCPPSVQFAFLTVENRAAKIQLLFF